MTGGGKRTPALTQLEGSRPKCRNFLVIFKMAAVVPSVDSDVDIWRTCCGQWAEKAEGKARELTGGVGMGVKASVEDEDGMFWGGSGESESDGDGDGEGDESLTDSPAALAARDGDSVENAIQLESKDGTKNFFQEVQQM